MASDHGHGDDHRTDAELARMGANGDRRAFAVLMGRHRDRLHGICRRITCHHEDAQDALQDTMLLAWTRLPQFDGRSSVGTWLYRIATNAAIDETRKRARTPDPTDSIPEQASRVDNGSVVAARLDIERALARIPPHYRAVLVLREFCQLTYTEIAELRGLPLDTVKSQLSRGRQALAALLRDRSRVVA